MDAKELTLNIAVNLGRIGRWANEGKKTRVDQFLQETSEYLHQLELVPRSKRFDHTFQAFRASYKSLSSDVRLDDAWADDMFTWATILTHRAKLA